MSSRLHPRLVDGRLYGILDLGYTEPGRLESTTTALLAGGADLLQLRAKSHGPADIEGFVRRVLPLCRSAGVPLIVNDHPQIATTTGADGLHLGQDDGSLEQARAIVGPDVIIGRSTHSPAQAAAALAEGFDYIGFGPLFTTPTKPGRPAIGLGDIAAVEADVGGKIPVFCIGGINAETLPEVLAAGAKRVVVVSALLRAPDVAAATHALKEACGC